MVYLWSLGAALLATGMEGMFMKFPYPVLFPWIVLPAVGLNYCVYSIVRSSDNLVEALAVFAVANIFLRMGMSGVLGQEITVATWIIAALLLAANFVRVVA